MHRTKFTLWYDLIYLLEKFRCLCSTVESQCWVAVHELSILFGDVKRVLTIKLGKQGHRCTFVDLAGHEVMTLKHSETTLLVWQLRIAVTDAKSPCTVA